MFRFCWHKWGNWSGVIESYGGSQHQACKCEKCGAITTRKAVSITLTAQLQSYQINEAIEAVHGIKGET